MGHEVLGAIRDIWKPYALEFVRHECTGSITIHQHILHLSRNTFLDQSLCRGRGPASETNYLVDR